MKSQTSPKTFLGTIPIDKSTFFISLALSIIGILFIYSSQVNQSGGTLYLKQGFTLMLAIAFYFLFAKIDYHFYGNNFILLYCLGLLILLIVLIFGKTINGSTSWVDLKFFHLQMSEFAKLIYIVSFSGFMIRYQDNIPSLLFFFVGLGFLFPYLLMLMLQPDLGTGLIFIMIFMTLFFLGGGNLTIIFFLIPIAIIALFFPFLGHLSQGFLKDLFWPTKNYVVFIVIFIALTLISYTLYSLFFRFKGMFFITIALGIISLGLIGSLLVKMNFKPYHYNRIDVVFNPNLDPEGKGYNINQSLIAIGAGKLTGEGLANGSQNKGNFLPAKNTDFIMALIAEEWGFLGVLLVVVLNIFLIYKIFQIASEARDNLGFLIISGIGGMISVHFVINIFSTIGLLPVIGIPFPFVSYGGSSLVNNFIALGIVYNVKNNRYSFK